MLEKATLDVLANAAEIGLPEAAGVPASAYDPFLRPAIKKRVRRAVAQASASTRTPRGDHVLRLAFLCAHPGAPKGLDPNDERAVEEAFTALAKPFLPEMPKRHDPAMGAYRASALDREGRLLDTVAPRKRKPWPVTLGILVTVCVVALGAFTIAVGPYLLPSPIERFSRTPFGKSLGEPLTDAVVGSGVYGSPARRNAARTKMLAKPVQKQIGAPAFGELEAMLDAIPVAARSPAESTDEALKPLLAHVNALDADLSRAHVPALLHVYANGRPEERSVWITSFFVDSRHEVDVGGEVLRVARGRRLDELNLVDSLLYKGTYEDSAILSLDGVDEQLVQWLLTPLATGAPMGPEEWSASDHMPAAELARTASQLLSAEIMAYAHLSQEDAATLRDAIARRNDAMVSLNKMGIAVEATTRIRLPRSLVRALQDAVVTPFEQKLIDEVLRIDGRMKVYAKPVAPVAAELARLQEDQFAERFFEEKNLTDDVPDDAKLPGSRRARAIAASMLGTLSRPSPCPRLATWLALRTASDRNRGWDERVALSAAIDSLLHELGLSPEDAHPRGEELAVAAKAALEAPPEKLRDAAGRTYAALVGRPAPPLVRKAVP